MKLFSDWTDYDYNDGEGNMFSHWLEDDIEEKACKDDGDVKMFKEEDE